MGEEHPYGPGWEDLHSRTLERDGHACTRCGVGDRILQAHHIVPRGVGGPDRLENLVTVCRPCHGVMHPDNDSFDDVRHEAPLFPQPEAPPPVARMRTPADQVCDRCWREHSDPGDLLAWHRDESYHVLCGPCAEVVLAAHEGCDLETLEAWRQPPADVVAAGGPSSVRPSIFAAPPVAIERSPETLRERIVDDTPIRFLLNSRVGRALTGAALVGVGIVAIL